MASTEPTPPRESIIRSYLAANLHLVASGLELIQEEHKLPNSDGASGSIDILARDTFERWVIIEIKRADQSARQALHELEKYAALLASERGIRVDQLRCILISTTWHELRVPFARFVSHVDYLAEGRLLHLGPDGIPAGSELVTLPRLSTGLELCPRHVLFVFSSRQNLDHAANVIDEELAELSVGDYIVLKMVYAGDSETVIYPHLLYLALAQFSEELSDHVRPLLLDSIVGEDAPEPTSRDDTDNCDDLGVEDCGHDNEEESDDEWPWQLEELAGAAVARRVSSLSQETELGTPDKFQNLRDWVEVDWRGNGRFAHKQVWSPTELRKAVSGTSETFSTNYQNRVSVGHVAAWRRMRETLHRVFEGIPVWRILMDSALDEVHLHPTADVSIDIFAPGDLLMSLLQLARHGDARSMPSLQLQVHDVEYARIYLGTLLWDGVTIVRDAQSIIDDAFDGDFFHYLVRRTTGGISEVDATLCQLHGFTYGLLEFMPDSPDGDPGIIFRLHVDGEGSLAREITYPEELYSLNDYVAAHGQYLDELKDLFAQNTFGL